MRKIWTVWLVILLCVAILGTAAVWLIQRERYTLSLELKGESVIAVEKGHAFEDPGVNAQVLDYFGKHRAAEVTCQGGVNTDQLGVYRLCYRSEFYGQTCTVYRDVHVVETLLPVITLQTQPGWYTLPGAEYKEEGFTAEHWLDGDITHLVERTVSGNVVTYTVTSSTGYTASTQRVIEYSDPVAPELVLLGEQEMLVSAGHPYNEPGCQAYDNADGDITDRVEISGQVDVYRPGVYPVTYTVSDSYGNTTTVVRNVNVAITQTNPESSTGKIIYLTFDDGPSDHTGRLLEILAKYDVKATFFLVNTGNIGIASRIAAEGHTVAIHTATHNFSRIYASEDAYFADLYRMQGIIADLTGQTTYLMRFPGGSSNTVSKAYCEGIMTRLVQAVRERGFRYFDWNVDSMDAGGATTAEEVFQNVIAGCEGKNTAIVLQHDTHGFSVDAVERIIIWGLANGYTFLPLTEGSPSCAHGVYN